MEGGATSAAFVLVPAIEHVLGKKAGEPKSREVIKQASLRDPLVVFRALACLELSELPRDAVQAGIEQLRKLADSGHCIAQFCMAGVLDNGLGGVDEDTKQAVVYHFKAAAQGDARAQSNLASMLDNGRGCDKDARAATAWYAKAAAQGEENAMQGLGILYQYGRGVAQNDVEAVEWYRRAAELGHIEACTCLGWMLANGFALTGAVRFQCSQQKLTGAVGRVMTSKPWRGIAKPQRTTTRAR